MTRLMLCDAEYEMSIEAFVENMIFEFRYNDTFEIDADTFGMIGVKVEIVE